MSTIKNNKTKKTKTRKEKNNIEENKPTKEQIDFMNKYLEKLFNKLDNIKKDVTKYNKPIISKININKKMSNKEKTKKCYNTYFKYKKNLQKENTERMHRFWIELRRIFWLLKVIRKCIGLKETSLNMKKIAKNVWELM
jgi:hypothetical protein